MKHRDRKFRRWITRLAEAQVAILNDGTSSQVGLTAHECRDLAAFLHYLTNETVAQTVAMEEGK